MDAALFSSAGAGPTVARWAALPPSHAAPAEKSELRKAFDDFVGQTFYGQMLKSMRQSLGTPAYFHGGRAEEIFQNQLDQVVAERMTDATAHQLTGPMFELFTLPRS